jgi:hypothetical protein
MNTTNGTTDIDSSTQALLAALDARSRDIVSRRYGIKTGKVETLEAIGKEYGITRERVRQIQSQAIKVLVELTDILESARHLFDDIFMDHGGLMTDRDVAHVLKQRLTNSPTADSVVGFYLDILPPYSYVVRASHFGPHWCHDECDISKAVSVVEATATLLRLAKHPVEQIELFDEIRSKLKETAGTLPDTHIQAYLAASKTVEQTPFKEWGLAGWPETNPRGVGDKAYAVLRRHGNPEHFTIITDLINKAQFDHKRANAQTVHNELIKDSRFVLVGRGLYGLAEWGYIPGTVADVIESLLKKADEPLSREEVITQVLAQRQVKKNTILLGLQNQKRFVRTPENRYELRER